MHNYWLNLYKPRGISSAQLVSKIKRYLQGAKIGHCGTLDVEAEGVLPLAIGEATKLVRLLVDARKTYIFTIQFGAKTDSGDSAGIVIQTSNYLPTTQACYDICSKFIGTITQIPPAFSAIKVAGVRSYELARQGVTALLPSRNVTIYNLECLNVNAQNHQATYKAIVAKGTYIRTLAEDIALSLQSLAFVVELRRTGVGLFREEDSIQISMLDSLDQEKQQIFLEENNVKLEAVLDDILVLDVSEEQANKIKFGQKCYFDSDKDCDLVWVRFNDILLAIGAMHNNCFKSFRVFNLINKENN